MRNAPPPIGKSISFRNMRPLIHGGDFAETWAHYLHIVDTLEMVGASGMSVRPAVDKVGDHTATANFDPYRAKTIEQIIDAWLPFVFTMNSVSRAMGERELYPSVLAPAVVNKLGFTHSLVHVGL